MPSSIALTSPLPAADLLFESMSASSGLSALGEIQLNLLSEKADLKAEDILGKLVTVTVQLRDGGQRFLNGYVTRFGIGVHQGRFFSYQATVHPWLWFLTRTADCRVFQNESVPDIVKKVFQDHDVASFDFKLFRSYRQWVYCVQYRESDFNFVTRLLEHEGIYWYFEHTDGHHKLVLIDSASAHNPAPSCDSLPYVEYGADKAPDTDCISDWSFSRGVRTGKVALASYDFERPSTDLKVKSEKDRGVPQSTHEVFDFQGDYVQSSDGGQWAEDRIDEQQTPFELLRGSSNAHGVEAGRLLSMTRHPRADQNAQYLVTGAVYRASVGSYQAEGGAGMFHCAFTAIPAAQQFRPPRVTPKPFVQGPQTAVVVGPAGEELFTDKYGRVKVQFHWDRAGGKNEKSSCWVRVSHPWAGKNFGMVQVPRIGQEVVVHFLEGDPDQPLITGRVYNAEQMPPWDLPANATQSGILSRSSKGGGYGNANALRFEDKKGAEQLWMHAEKDQLLEVEHDEKHWVGNDRVKNVDHDETTTIGHDRTETVGNNETITVGVNRTEKVGANEVIGIGANRTETVGANETITIGANRTISTGASETATVALQRTHAVGINETIAIGAAQEVAIGAAQIITVGAIQSTSVGASQTNTIGTSQTNTIGASQTNTIGAGQSSKIGASRDIDVGASQSSKIGSDRSADVGGADSLGVGKDRSTKVGDDDSLKVGKNLVIDAGDSVLIKTGSASIHMKKDGTITIKGKDITLDGSGKIHVKADGNVVIKGSKILQN